VELELKLRTYVRKYNILISGSRMGKSCLTSLRRRNQKESEKQQGVVSKKMQAKLVKNSSVSVGIYTDAGEGISTLSPSDALDFAMGIISVAKKAIWFQNIPRAKRGVK
jgi:hypothetical protein